MYLFRPSVKGTFIFAICHLDNYDLNLDESNILLCDKDLNDSEKGENGGNQLFLLFPQCFLPFQRQCFQSFPNQSSSTDQHLIFSGHL